jgi:hypothetical protein
MVAPTMPTPDQASDTQVLPASALQLTRSQRHRLRKRGFVIPFKPMPVGYQHAPEHNAKIAESCRRFYAVRGGRN